MDSWYVYILKCADGSFYTGITKDLSRRVEEHNHDNQTGAAYTRGRRPVKLIYQESHSTHSLAARREYEIKQMSRQEKERMIAS